MNCEIGEVIHSIDTLKKRLLQIEYLGNKYMEKFSQMAKTMKYKDMLAQAKDIEDVSIVCHTLIVLGTAIVKTYINENGFFPSEDGDRICESVLILDEQDYDVYTRKNYGNYFWNEIELPYQCLDLFEKLREICGLEHTAIKKEYEICLYDMSNNSLYFKTLREAEEMLKTEDLVPFTLYENTMMEGSDVYDSQELYSA